jgi:hypothetical protein
MQDTMVALTWFVGALFGAFWTSSLELGHKKNAKLHGVCMVYCYFLDAVIILAAGSLSYWWFLALYSLAALLLSLIIAFGRKRNHQ